MRVNLRADMKVWRLRFFPGTETRRFHQLHEAQRANQAAITTFFVHERIQTGESRLCGYIPRSSDPSTDLKLGLDCRSMRTIVKLSGEENAGSVSFTRTVRACFNSTELLIAMN